MAKCKVCGEFKHYCPECQGVERMPKAILELPKMPEGCWQCPFIQDRSETYRWCGAVGGDCPNPPYEKRRDDCPLKPVEKGGDE